MKTIVAAFFAVVLALPLPVASGADKPEYVASFDPAKGFKPAQRDLTEIFLQIAGSLEYYGSPVPYLRHMQQEYARIEALYQRKFGKAPKSYRPSYMTDEYIDHLSANWNMLSPKLGLEPYAKDFGHSMSNAILGTRGTGTIIVDIFNQHQTKVFDEMVGEGDNRTDFETLRTELVSRLELDKTSVAEEHYDVAHRDAVSFALGIQGSTKKLFAKIDRGLKPEAAESVKAVLTSAILDTGMMAQSELEAGIAEWAITKPSTAGR